ncbi:Bacterial Ig-like domain (group 2) [Pseudoscardovia radai]|uniref:Bacterial Ig-like domain (Group 2) n=1 Tax=Pseudoscardovia radai TaxID=987066 RepID=A0A261F362_9BIFI|nr:Ig-like domain-containing protein [Pseudoscardovia radai]OZG53569.1 Bacterial Ig-like domain (group 2) [Pseudoscardovia radai]
MEGTSMRSRVARKAVGLLVAMATLLTGGIIVASSTTTTASAASTTSYDRTLGNATFEAARQKYGFTKEMKDGAILHAWEWSFNTISANMADIAAAGYTSIQTEPIQKCKQNTANGMKFDENWYYVYQPIDTQVGNFVVGTEDEFKAMCAKAHEYGIRIIVDVVANHMTADFGAIQGRWANASLYHPHESVGNNEWGDRWKVTHKCLLGLWDIDSNNPDNGKAMQSFLQEVVQDGADGFRFDAAKHIELPGEFSSDSNGSPYWTYILNNGAQYQYGEVLHDSISRDNDYANLFSNASSNGGGVTASQYGYTIRNAITSSNLNAGSLGSYNSSVNPDRLVTWVESHDNYANTDKLSVGITDYQLTMGWAIIGARAEGAPLFFDRPYGSGGNNAQYTEQTKLGDKGSDLYKDPQVAAVNHFRNQMDGNAEYMANCGSNSCLMIERYKSDGNSQNDGVVIANMGGDANLSGTSVKLDDGTYTDEVSNGTITVSGGKITSGTAKGGKVSVFYNHNSSLCNISASVADGKSFTTDSLDVTLIANDNCKTTSYSTSEGKSGSFSNGDTITVGSSISYGETVTLTLTATDKDGNSYKATYTYKKKDPSAVSVAYATKPASWASLYAYVYIDDPSAASITQNAAWPGVAMTKLTAADSCGEAGMYRYEIPSDYDGTVRVIFTDGQTGTSTKYPADTTQGDDAAGLQIDGTYYWDGGTSWTEMSCQTVTVNSVSIDQDDYTTDISAGSTTKKLTATVDPSTAKVSWSSSNSAVASVASDGTVTAKKAGSATITAKAGSKSDSITVTVTGTAPAAANVIYVTKPSGWSTVYAYMYTGSGTSAASNAKWPGVALTQMTADDNCAKSGTYMYEVPDDLASGAKVILSDNGSGTNRYPADMVPGMDYNGGPVSWTSGSTSLSDVTCAAPIVDVKSVTLDQSALTLTEGDSATLTATVAPSNATDKTVTWKSSDDSVATVSNGKVTAVKAGTATITATSSNGKTASATVTVNPATVDVTGVTISTDSLKLVEGQNGTLTASVTPSNATDKTITWESSDPSVATVSGGVVTAVKAGTATITAKSSNGKTATCTVTVTAKTVAVSEVTVEPSSLTLTVGEYNAVSATVKPDNATDKTVTWTSTDPSVATVDNTGLVHGVAKGSTFLIAKAGDKSATVTVTVKDAEPQPVPVTGVTISTDSLKLVEGQNGTLTASVTPSNATDKTITWESSDPSVATVNGGIVTAVKAGTATITAKSSNGKSATCTVTVNPATVPVTGVSVTPSIKSLYVGDATQLTATVSPSNATNKTVTWTSSNPSVATVDANGIVTARAQGTASISAKAGSYTAYSTINVTAKTVAVESVSVSPATVGVKVGAATRLTATVLPANATDQSLTWISDNQSVATVDANGVVTGVKEGTAKITAFTKNGVSGEATVTVSAVSVPVTGVSLSPSNPSVVEGATTRLTATVAPANATDQSLTWISDNQSVATVDQNGVVTGVKKGTAKITAFTSNGVSGTVTVTVKAAAIAVTGVTVAPENASVTAGQTVQLTATVTPANATNKTVTWTSSDTSIATVNANGLVTGVKGGTAAITANASGYSNTAIVTVNPSVVPVQSLAITPNPLSLAEGDMQQLTAIVTPSNATDKTVTWKSLNESIATVDQNGVVTAVKEGTATIYAYTNNGVSAQAAVKVAAKTTSDTVKMERLYNPNSGEHLFSSDQNEIGVLIKIGWTDEGYAWTAPTTGTPVYRVYNPNTGDHHYTLDLTELQHLTDAGWRNEGVKWYSAPKSTGIPVYRLYNPNASQFSHHYSSSWGEIENLRKIGWNYEDIGWYGVKE